MQNAKCSGAAQSRRTSGRSNHVFRVGTWLPCCPAQSGAAEGWTPCRRRSSSGCKFFLPAWPGSQPTTGQPRCLNRCAESTAVARKGASHEQPNANHAMPGHETAGFPRPRRFVPAGADCVRAGRRQGCRGRRAKGLPPNRMSLEGTCPKTLHPCEKLFPPADARFPFLRA